MIGKTLRDMISPKPEHEDTDPKIVVGLDIGTTKIATIIGYKSENKIDILGYGRGESTGVQHGLIFNINKTVEGINISKEQAENRLGSKVDTVYVGVAGRHIRSMEYKHVLTRLNGKNSIIRQDEIDNMQEDLRHISVAKGEKIITVIPQRYIIDHSRETYEPVGEMGELIEGYFQIVTANEDEIRKILLCVESAGLKANNIILEPIASGLACVSEEEKKQGVALVDIGGGTTDVAIYHKGHPVFTCVIPIGGTIITKDIVSVCRIPEELAEKLKKNCGTCIVEKSNSNNYVTLPQMHAIQSRQISETHLAQIINKRVQIDILDHVKEAIDRSGYADKLNAGIVLTGGGSTLRHIKELCEYTLQKPVRIGIPEFGFVHSIPNELKHPMYSTSLGLLKYGIEEQDSMKDTNDEEDFTPVVDNEDKPVGKMDKPKKPQKSSEASSGLMKSIQQFFIELVEKTS